MAHRVTALALTAAMAAALASPAFAGWTVDMSQVKGDVTIEKKANGTVTISVDGDTQSTGVTKEGDDDNVTITDGRKNSVDNSGSNGSDGQSDTSGSSAVTMEAKDAQPVDMSESEEEMTYTDTDEDADINNDKSNGKDDPQDGGSEENSEENTEESSDPEEESEEKEKSEGGNSGSDNSGTNDGTEGGNAGAEGGSNGTTSPENDIATQETPAGGLMLTTGSKNNDKNDSNAVTYESKTPVQKVAAAVQDATIKAVSYVVNIINKSNSALNVTLDNVNIKAENRYGNALTVSGSGSTSLTFKGDNTLTGDEHYDGLSVFGGTNLTITGAGTDSTLTANGGKSNTNGGSGKGIDVTGGSLTIKGEGTVNANGGSDGGDGGSGIYIGGKLSIEGDITVNAKGGDGAVASPSTGANGGAGIKSSGVTISGNSKVTAIGGNGDNANGGAGINSSGVTISGNSKVTAIGGNTEQGWAGAGIRSNGNVTVEESAVIEKAEGGTRIAGSTGNVNGGAGIYATSKVYVNGGTIEVAKGGDGGGVHDKGFGGQGGDGISGQVVEINNGTIGVLKKDGTIEAGTGAVGGTSGTSSTSIWSGTGINSTGYNEKITINNSKVNAEGRCGIDSYTDIEISGDKTNITATGTSSGILSSTTIAISGGSIKAAGGDGGILSSKGNVTITGGDVKATATGQNGIGIWVHEGDLAISGGTVTASADGKDGVGIRSGNNITISGATTEVTASAEAEGGVGIRSCGNVTIEGGSTTVTGGSGAKGRGIDLRRFNSDAATAENLKISGEGTTVTINGGRGGYCITATNSDLTNTKDITGEVNATDGATLIKNQSTEPVTPDTPETPETPVTPETPAPVVTSDDGDSTPAPEAVVITPAGVPGFRFTGMLGSSISVKADVNGSTMEFSSLRYAAAMHTTLGQLRQLKEQGITHVTFRTLLSTTTFAIDDLLPLGDDSAEVLLTHNGRSAKLTVGGVER